MTRHSFGGGTADFVQEVDNQGIVHAGNGATCTFFTAQTGGTAITDLTDLANNPITSVSADANGGVPSFMGPNDGTSAMWVSAGGSARQLMQATDIPTRIIALETSGIGGGGGGTVTSVNGVSPVSGAVTLAPSNIGADVAGAASTAQANAIAASMQRANNGSDIASAPAFRTALGLGTAATQDSAAFDIAGAATTAQSNAQAASDPLGSAAAAQANAIAASEPLLKVVGPKSTNYAGLAQEMSAFDLTSGNLTYTLPNNPSNNTVAGAKIVVQPGTNVLTINCAGSDVIDVAGGAVTTSVKLLGQGKTFKYNTTGHIWTVVADNLPLSQLDTRYRPVRNTLANRPAASAVPWTLYQVTDDVTQPVYMSDGTAWWKVGLGTRLIDHVEQRIGSIPISGTQTAMANIGPPLNVPVVDSDVEITIDIPYRLYQNGITTGMPGNVSWTFQLVDDLGNIRTYIPITIRGSSSDPFQQAQAIFHETVLVDKQTAARYYNLQSNVSSNASGMSFTIDASFAGVGGITLDAQAVN